MRKENRRLLKNYIIHLIAISAVFAFMIPIVYYFTDIPIEYSSQTLYELVGIPLLPILTASYYEIVIYGREFEKGRITGFLLGFLLSLILAALMNLANIGSKSVFTGLNILLIIAGWIAGPKASLVRKMDDLIYNKYFERLRKTADSYR